MGAKERLSDKRFQENMKLLRVILLFLVFSTIVAAVQVYRAANPPEDVSASPMQIPRTKTPVEVQSTATDEPVVIIITATDIPAIIETVLPVPTDTLVVPTDVIPLPDPKPTSTFTVQPVVEEKSEPAVIVQYDPPKKVVVAATAVSCDICREEKRQADALEKLANAIQKLVDWVLRK